METCDSKPSTRSVITSATPKGGDGGADGLNCAMETPCNGTNGASVAQLELDGKLDVSAYELSEREKNEEEIKMKNQEDGGRRIEKPSQATVEYLLQEVRSLQRKLNQALIESHEATIAARKHADASSAAAALASKLARIYKNHDDSDHVGTTRNVPADASKNFAPENVDVTSVLHEAEGRLISAESRCKAAEISLQEKTSEYEIQLQQLRHEMDELRGENRVLREHQKQLNERLRTIQLDHSEACGIAGQFVGEDISWSELSIPELVEFVIDKAKVDPDECDKSAAKPQVEAQGFDGVDQTVSSFISPSSVYYSAVSSDEDNLEQVDSKYRNQCPSTPPVFQSVNHPSSIEVEVLRTEMRRLEREALRRGEECRKLTTEIEKIKEMQSLKSPKIVSGRHIASMETLDLKLQEEHGSFEEIIDAYKDVKSQLKRTMIDLDNAKQEVDRLQSLRTLDAFTKSITTIPADANEIPYIGRAVSAEAIKKALLVKLAELEKDEVSSHDTVVYRRLPATAFSLYIRALEEENSALVARNSQFEKELLDTREMLGHKNAQQRIQYHKKLKTKLEEMRREATSALRDRFQLENAVRYLSAVSGRMPELRHPADALRPESLSGRQDLVSWESDDFNEAAKHAEDMIEQKILEVCRT